MRSTTLELWTTTDPDQARTADGAPVEVPAGWVWLPAGDATLTRRVKGATPTWVVKTKRGRRTLSLGLWASRACIDQARERLDAERAEPKYAARLEAQRARRGVAQAKYVEEFRAAVATFLAFAPRYAELEQRVAFAIAEHATPVGSGTVARTRRIALDRRAEAATIAWLRHQTTTYDDMKIARIEGMRREVRRLLAQRSRRLLDRYRRGQDVDGTCPLTAAILSVMGEHTPAVPADSADALRAEILEARSYGEVHVWLGERDTAASASEARDASVARGGFEVVPRSWRESSPAAASSMVTQLLHRDMAYLVEIMPRPRAAELWERLLRWCGGDSSRVFSNGRLESDGSGSFDFSLTDATFDAGVVVVGETRVALLWVGDED